MLLLYIYIRMNTNSIKKPLNRILLSIFLHNSITLDYRLTCYFHECCTSYFIIIIPLIKFEILSLKNCVWQLKYRVQKSVIHLLLGHNCIIYFFKSALCVLKWNKQSAWLWNNKCLKAVIGSNKYSWTLFVYFCNLLFYIFYFCILLYMNINLYFCNNKW